MFLCDFRYAEQHDPEWLDWYRKFYKEITTQQMVRGESSDFDATRVDRQHKARNRIEHDQREPPREQQHREQQHREQSREQQHREQSKDKTKEFKPEKFNKDDQKKDKEKYAKMKKRYTAEEDFEKENKTRQRGKETDSRSRERRDKPSIDRKQKEVKQKELPKRKHTHATAVKVAKPEQRQKSRSTKTLDDMEVRKEVGKDTTIRRRVRVEKTASASDTERTRRKRVPAPPKRAPVKQELSDEEEEEDKPVPAKQPMKEARRRKEAGGSGTEDDPPEKKLKVAVKRLTTEKPQKVGKEVRTKKGPSSGRVDSEKVEQEHVVSSTDSVKREDKRDRLEDEHQDKPENTSPALQRKEEKETKIEQNETIEDVKVEENETSEGVEVSRKDVNGDKKMVNETEEDEEEVEEEVEVEEEEEEQQETTKVVKEVPTKHYHVKKPVSDRRSSSEVEVKKTTKKPNSKVADAEVTSDSHSETEVAHHKRPSIKDRLGAKVTGPSSSPVKRGPKMLRSDTMTPPMKMKLGRGGRDPNALVVDVPELSKWEREEDDSGSEYNKLPQKKKVEKKPLPK